MLKRINFPDYNFYDLSAKINYLLSEKTRFYFSFYSGRDKIMEIDTHSEHEIWPYKYTTDEEQFYGWGNKIASVRWNQVINKGLFSNTSVNYSNYNYFDKRFLYNKQINVLTNDVKNVDYESKFHSGINDFSLKSDFDYQSIEGHNIKFGLAVFNHIFTPDAIVSQYDTEGDSTVHNDIINKINTLESAVYLEDEIEPIKRLKIRGGMRFSGLIVENKYYKSFEPRLSAEYRFSDFIAINTSYSSMKQYLHLLTTSRVTFSTDLWVPCTNKIKPQSSDQVTLGTKITFNKNFEFSLEGYYKTMNNLIEYSEGSSFLDNNNWQSKVETGGRGRAYGLETFLQLTTPKTTGWISYTLAKSERQFDNISFGKWFPYKYDRRHDLSIIINHRFSKVIDAGVTYELSSGDMVTIISQVYEPLGSLDNWLMRIQYFENRNNYRLPLYHRMDIGINFHHGNPRFKSTWSINIYNVYNHKNIFFVYWGNDKITNDLKLKGYTLFPILPSLTYSIKF